MDRADVIRLADDADAYADEVLGRGEFHPNWHEVRDERFAALVRAQVLEDIQRAEDAIRGMKSEPGHSVSSVAEASTAPAPAEPGATAGAEPVWCGCGDGIMPDTGAKCWICAANDATEIEDLRAENAELQRALTMSGKLSRKLAEEALAHGREWPAGLIDRVKAAAKRIDDNRAPRSIPADPHSDVDLVLAEVRCFLEGSAPPFWVPGAPRCRSADTGGTGRMNLNLAAAQRN